MKPVGTSDCYEDHQPAACSHCCRSLSGIKLSCWRTYSLRAEAASKTPCSLLSRGAEFGDVIRTFTSSVTLEARPQRRYTPSTFRPETQTGRRAAIALRITYGTAKWWHHRCVSRWSGRRSRQSVYKLTVGCDMGDAAFDGLWYRPPWPHIHHWVKRLMCWAVTWCRRMWRGWFLIVQSCLEMVVPRLTAVLLLETEGNAPDEKKHENAVSWIPQANLHPSH